MVEQVTDIVTIELQELDFDLKFAKFRLLSSILDLFEDEVKNAWHYAHLIEG